MPNQKAIEFIVKSYSLSPRLEERIIQIALRRVNELSISGFNDIYSYITGLVEAFNMPFTEKLAMRLDSAVRDSKKTFHELIGQDELAAGFADEDEEETEEDKLGEMPLDDIICRLEGKLGQKELDVLKQLSLQYGHLSLPCDITTIEENADDIAERLKQLIQTYERDGKFIMPKRPIIYIRFNPLAIRFGKRRYNGNPLAYFREHIKTYKGMSRKELSRYDQSLYLSLCKSNQIVIAIPHTKRKIVTKEDIPAIIQAHASCDGNASLAARNLQYSPSVILRQWKLRGLSCLGNKGKDRGRYADKDPLILFKEQQKYANMNRRELAMYDPGLYRKLHRAGKIDEAIPLDRRPQGKRLTDEEIMHIIDSYHIYGGDVNLLAKKLPYSFMTICKYLRLKGLIPCQGTGKE